MSLHAICDTYPLVQSRAQTTFAAGEKTAVWEQDHLWLGFLCEVSQTDSDNSAVCHDRIEHQLCAACSGSSHNDESFN